MSVESVMPILCRPRLFLPSIFPSIRVFSNESVLRIRWPKYWSFSFSVSPSNEHPGLISFRIDWLYIMQNPRLDEAQAGIKIAGRNSHNLRYADAAAAAKLCPTLYNPIDDSPSGSSVHGIL